jgi:hypothetical protein
MICLLSIKISIFKYENGIKTKNSPYPVISRTYFLFNETFYSLPQSREIILLRTHEKE